VFRVASRLETSGWEDVQDSRLVSVVREQMDRAALLRQPETTTFDVFEHERVCRACRGLLSESTLPLLHLQSGKSGDRLWGTVSAIREAPLRQAVWLSSSGTAGPDQRRTPEPLIRPPLIRLPHLLTRSTSPAVSLPQFTRTTSPAVSLPQYLSRSISPAVSLPQYFSCSTSPAVPQPSREVHPQNNNQHDDDSAQRRIQVRAFRRLIGRRCRLVRQAFQLFA